MLGGRRVLVRRPRVRTADGESEVALQTYEHCADRDRLEKVVLERMLAGVSTRRYRRAREPVGDELEGQARSTSKSAASRMFVRRTRQQLWHLMNRPLADLRLAVMMLDGIELHGRTNVVALGITTTGEKLALGLGDGSSENATDAAALLADLVDRGANVLLSVATTAASCAKPLVSNYRVAVIECGRRFADQGFASTMWEQDAPGTGLFRGSGRRRPGSVGRGVCDERTWEPRCRLMFGCGTPVSDSCSRTCSGRSGGGRAGCRRASWRSGPRSERWTRLTWRSGFSRLGVRPRAGGADLQRRGCRLGREAPRPVPRARRG
ncbi:MAG TPA: transposase [Solirubrobacteraceae bacterium]|nr:transposase [Solirubrobacteraceae bacterium]